MKIRIADTRDLDAIVGVHLRSSKAAYSNLPASVVAVSAESRRVRWGEALAEPDSLVWVADDAGQVVGFCHLRIFSAGSPDAGSAEIVSLYLDPARWHQGIGRALVERARSAAWKRLCSRLFLKVYAENARARAAYEAMGFAVLPGAVVHERTGLLLVYYEMRLPDGPDRALQTERTRP